jgi:hypothetical protein
MPETNITIRRNYRCPNKKHLEENLNNKNPQLISTELFQTIELSFY